MRTDMIQNSALEVATGAVTNRAMRWGRGNTNTDVSQQELVYAMESKDATNLAGKNVVWSFFIRKGANFDSDLSLRVTAGEGKDQGVISAWTNDTDIFGDSIANADIPIGFERVYFTFTVPQVKTQIRLIMNYVPTGTAGVDEYIDVTSFQLEIGTLPSIFKRSGDTIEGELANCQRYYEKTYDPDTTPGAITSAGVIAYHGSVGISNPAFVGNLQYKVKKRVTATTNIWNNVTGTNTWRDNLGSNVGMSLFMNGTNGVAYQPTTGQVNGAVTWGHITADAEL